MKNYLLFILTLTIFSGCFNQQKRIQFYPDDSIFSKKNLEVINLDSSKLTFKQITDSIGDYHNRFGKLVLKFRDKNVEKNVIPFVFDEGLIKNNPSFTITHDSILRNENQLDSIIMNHYYQDVATTYSNLITISLDTSTTSNKLKKTLLKLTSSFDRIKDKTKDSIKLRLFFDYKRQLTVPPPPPLPNE